MFNFISDTIYSYSDIVIVLLVMITYTSVGLFLYGGLMVLFPRFNQRSTPHWGSAVLGTVLSINSILLTFTLIQSVSTMHGISAMVAGEIAALHRLEKVVVDSDVKGSGIVHAQLVAYVRQIISGEWDAMSKEEHHRPAEKAFDDLIVATYRFSHDFSRHGLSAELVTNPLNNLIDARHARLMKKNTSLPRIYFEVIFMLECVLVAITYISGTVDKRSLANLGLHLSILGTILGLVVVYDHPYLGESGVKDTSYRQLLDSMENKGP